MSSLVAFYRESVESVADLWNASAEQLGLEVLRPLAPGDRDWDIFRQQDTKLFIGLYQLFDGLVHLLIEPGLNQEALFERILELPLQPVEVFLVDISWEFAEQDVFCLAGQPEPADQLDAIESGWFVWGVRYLQALHRDLLSDTEEWKCAARERGFPLRSHGAYHILDVHWSDAAPWPNEPEGLPRSTNDDVDRHMQAPTGTMILLRVTAVEPNLQRGHAPWLEVIPRVVEVLSESLAAGDTLRRFYTPREFVILKSALTCAEAPAELERLRKLLEEQLTPWRVRGLLSSASWPEEAPDREEMIAGSGWDKLRNDQLSLAL